MRKIPVFLIIFCLLLVNFKGFIFAQDLNQEQSELQNQVELPRLKCELPKISLEETIGEVTSTYDFITPMETFKAETYPERNWWDEVRDFVKSLLKQTLMSLAESLLGKVPIGAPEINNALGQSIKESTKNILASIRTAIALSIKDSQYYLQYKIWNELSNKIHQMISKNYIPDISSYKNLRIFLAYLRAISTVVENRKTCIDPDLKPCLDNLVIDMKNTANELANKNPKLEPWVNRIFKYIDPKINNLYCTEMPATISGIIKINNISIKPNKIKLKNNQISFYIKNNFIKANIGLLNEPVYFSLIDPKGNELAKIYVDPNKSEDYVLWDFNQISNNIIKNSSNLSKNYTFGIKSCISNYCKLNRLNFALVLKSQNKFNLASLFSSGKKIISLRSIFAKIPFLAQTYQTGESSINTGDYPIPHAFETENYLTKCEMVSSGIYMDVFDKLQKEIEKVDTILAAGGGFKEKISCLATWDGSDPSNISGDDPRCKIPGPTLTYPDVYKKLQEQVLSGELDIFKNKEQTENLMVSYIRSWLDSKLFNIIDKGFASLEAKLSGSGYSSEVLKAYNTTKINQVCERTGSLNIPGLKENCKAVLQSQGELIMKNIQAEGEASFKKSTIILTYINELKDILDDYYSIAKEIKSKYEENSSMISEENKKSIEEKINEIFQILEDDKNSITSTINDLNMISNNINIQEVFDIYKEKINIIKNSPTSTELESIKSQISDIEQQIATSTMELQKLFNNLSKNIGRSSKILNAFVDRDFIIKLTYAKPNLNKLDYGDKNPLSFYKYFYPNYVYELDKITSYYNRYENPASCAAYISSWMQNTVCYPEAGVGLDLGMILNIFFNIPKSAAIEDNLINSFQNYMNSFMNGEVTINQSDINTLYYFSQKLMSVKNKLQKYIESKNLSDKEFSVNIYNQEYVFEIGDLMEYLENLSNNFYYILDYLVKNDITTKLNELNKLKNKEKELQDWVDKKYNEAWEESLNKISPEDLNQLYAALENAEERVETISNTSYENCENINEIIDGIESDMNMALMESKLKENIEIEEKIPEEEEAPQSKGVIKTFFASLKNFAANIFKVFIKPKGVYLK